MGLYVPSLVATDLGPQQTLLAMASMLPQSGILALPSSVILSSVIISHVILEVILLS